MEQKTIRKRYISQLYVIDKKNIEDFEFLPNHRMLREPQVERIYGILNKGKHFESPIVVNQRGRKMRIIDGGHRVNAMMRFLKNFPEKQIEVNMAVYRELNDDEELEVFGVWNKGIKQSPNDYLNLRKSEIPIIKLFEKEFPCKVSIYSPGEDGIRLKILLGAYIGAKFLDTPNSYDGRIESFIDKVKELGHNDYKFLKRFMEGFIVTFGTPGTKNSFSSYVVFTAIMRVYYDNFYKQGDSYLWNKMKSHVFKSSVIMQYSLAGGSRLMVEPCHTEILRLLNKGKRSNFFILQKRNVKVE